MTKDRKTGAALVLCATIISERPEQKKEERR